ncbi:hypothetical protein ACFXPW_33430 [Streptomyces goshikiensis]|uniref:hypothetical protein n=1 Tax=Streptomyces goshikiensis TaxID=1942 RepID=UPI0036A9D821
MNGRHDDISFDTSEFDKMLEGVGRRNERTVAAPLDGTTAAESSGKKKVVNLSKYTVLLNEQDALAFDQLAYEMRAIAGRRVEKSEIMRAMIHLASIDTTVNRILGQALDRRRQA